MMGTGVYESVSLVESVRTRLVLLTGASLKKGVDGLYINRCLSCWSPC